MLAESVGLVMLVVLDTLGPAERTAFVLHDMFAVPFSEIAPIVDRSPTAAKKLASRARQRVHAPAAVPDTDLAEHRHVVDAFLAAARGGDIDALLAVLHTDVVRRADRVAVPADTPTELRGARAVAKETATNAQRARFAQPALLNGAVGVLVAPRGRLFVAITLAIADGRITDNPLRGVWDDPAPNIPEGKTGAGSMEPRFDQCRTAADQQSKEAAIEAASSVAAHGCRVRRA